MYEVARMCEVARMYEVGGGCLVGGSEERQEDGAMFHVLLIKSTSRQLPSCIQLHSNATSSVAEGQGSQTNHQPHDKVDDFHVDRVSQRCRQQWNQAMAVLHYADGQQH